MILFANWSGHTESFLSWLGASESQPPRVCEIFQPAVALRLSGEEHPSNVEVILGEEHPSNVEVISGEEHSHNIEVISGESHSSDVEVILGEEHPSSCSGVILSLSKNRLNEVAGK